MMHVAVRDEEAARKVATVLREVARRVEEGDVMYVGMTAVHTIAGARRYGYAAVDLNERLETLGLGEYFFVLCCLRDFYLKAEAQLVNGDDESENDSKADPT